MSDRIVELERTLGTSRMYLENISHKLDKQGEKKVFEIIWILFLLYMYCILLSKWIIPMYKKYFVNVFHKGSWHFCLILENLQFVSW